MKKTVLLTTILFGILLLMQSCGTQKYITTSHNYPAIKNDVANFINSEPSRTLPSGVKLYYNPRASSIKFKMAVFDDWVLYYREIDDSFYKYKYEDFSSNSAYPIVYNKEYKVSCNGKTGILILKKTSISTEGHLYFNGESLEIMPIHN